MTHLGQLGVVNQIRSVAVDEGAEGEAVLPAQVEVLHVHIAIGGRLALAPQQQTFLGGHLCKERRKEKTFQLAFHCSIVSIKTNKQILSPSTEMS